MILQATASSGLDWAITFLAYSTVILGGIALARVVARREIPEIAWRLAIVAAIAAAIPASARFGLVVDVGPSLQALGRTWETLVPAIDRDDPAAAIVMQPEERIAETALQKATTPVTTTSSVRAIAPTTQTDSRIPRRVALSMSDLRDSESLSDASWLPRSPGSTAGFLWALIASVLLIKLGRDYVRAARAFGHREPLDREHRAHALLKELCRAAEVGLVPRLTVSRTLNSPVSLIGNEICVPEWALRDLDREQLRGLLAHELAHQTRSDPIVFALLQILERVFFFQPLFRLAHARLRILAELAADDWAASHTRNGHAIASTLYACVARSLDRQPSFGIAIVTERSVLRHRVQRLLASDGVELRSMGRIATAALVCMTIALALALPTLRTAQAQGATPPSPPSVPAATSAPSAPSAPAPAAATRPATAPAAAASTPLAPTPAPASVPAIATRPSGPAAPSAPSPPSPPTGPSVSHLSIDDDSGNFQEVSGGTEIKVKWHGDFTLNDDESDIVAMTHAAILEIETTRKGETHRIEFAEHRGDIERTYYREGKEQPLDDAGRAWLADTLKTLLRTSGVHAEERVTRLLDKGGAKAVLDEMDHVTGSYVTRVYTELLVADTDLTDAEIRRLCDQHGRIEGDYDLRTALSAVLTEEQVSPQTMPDVLAVAKKIESSYDRRVLLEEVAQQPLTAPLLQAYREIASGIGGDYDLRLAVVAALDNSAVDGDGAAALVDLAARTLHADYDLSQVVQSTPQLNASGTATAAAIRAIGSIKSSYDQRVSLVHVVDQGKLDEPLWLALIATAAKIDSDYDRAEALSSIAAAMPLDDTTKAAYRKAADAIGSEYDRSRAHDALYDRGA